MSYLISTNFNIFPDATQTVKASEWRDFLLNHDRHIFCNGQMRELKGRNLGAGVIEVYSKPLKF